MISIRTSRLLGHLRRNRDGNVLVMTALAMLTLCFAFGFVVDYSRAEAAQTELNAIADAAALRRSRALAAARQRPARHDP